MVKYFLYLNLVVGISFILTAHANDALFVILDADENGYISLDETHENIEVRKKFSVLDINNDTQIDMQEFMLLNVDSSFNTFDQNEDLFISYEEALVSPKLEAQFIILDTDNDQKLDANEYSNFTDD